MKKLFNTAYCVAKHDFPIRSFIHLCELQTVNGVDLGHTYHNNKAATEFILCISEVELRSIVEKVNGSACFAILIDGSTDVSITEQEIIYVRILEDNKPQNYFLGIVSVCDATANNIKKELIEFLNSIGIVNVEEKLIALGTDGASVNLGAKGGIVALFQKDTPHLVGIHCVAHKLELGILDACKGIGRVGKFQDSMKGILKFYSNSSKRVREIDEIATVLEEASEKFGKWNAVRWIASKHRTMKAIKKNWKATVAHLEHIGSSSSKEEAALAKGHLKNIKSVDFVYFLSMMQDFYSVVAKISCAFQSDLLTLSDTQAEIENILESLGELKDEERSYVKEMKEGPQGDRDLRVRGEHTEVQVGFCDAAGQGCASDH